MRNIEKIRKQNSLSSELIIKTGLAAVIAGLIYALGTTFCTVVAVYIGYRAFGLVLRFLGLVTAAVFTVILIIIILILIF
jgi:formate/nitrite transporter FocA (FNT family)